tara:strand:- start:1554 stop:1898 length:345 start_codon:yes stop_codon:yes gene_type:complete
MSCLASPRLAPLEDRPDECQLNLAATGRCRLCSGLLALTFGIIVLALHDDWSSWQAGLVTTIGWLGLIKGITILALPAPFLSLTGSLLGQPAMLRPVALVVAVIGIGFLALGFV